MSEKILVINDEEPVRELISYFLQQKGYEVIEASSGPEGIELSATNHPDLILLDIVMPGMDGFEACIKLKQNPKTKDIPVIFLSSLIETKHKIKGLEIGAVDYITRVSDQGELLARVQTHLKIRALTKELIDRNQELVQKQQYLDEDLKAAAAIQHSLLPPEQLTLPNLDIAWMCQSCDLVGGDIFNLIHIDEQHLAFYILDVSGHGVPSAMVTVSVSQFMHESNVHLKEKNDQGAFSPVNMMRSLDNEFPFTRFNKFFTMFYMVLNVQTGLLKYSSAGHPPAVLLHPTGKLEVLSKGGAVIGINEELQFEEGELILKKGDKVILYTDGIVEFQNHKEEFYGSARFYEMLESVKDQPVATIIVKINQSLQEFGNDAPIIDDISALALEYLGISIE